MIKYSFTSQNIQKNLHFKYGWSQVVKFYSISLLYMEHILDAIQQIKLLITDHILTVVLLYFNINSKQVQYVVPWLIFFVQCPKQFTVVIQASVPT